MIIDSHAHYSRFKYDGVFSYLALPAHSGEDPEYPYEYDIIRGTRQELLEKLRAGGICGIIEPAIEFETNERLMELAEKYPGFVFPAVGLHPGRCTAENFRRRKALKAFATQSGVIAIGETGLDYHRAEKKAERRLQKKMFIYQIKLAHRHRLPLILHIRNSNTPGDTSAYENAYKILKRYSRYLHGGVAHCFSEDRVTADKFISLGFKIGIGGMLIGSGEASARLEDAVAGIPITSILVETDAPFVLPDNERFVCSSHQKRKILNSSLILPEIIEKIAKLKETTYAKAEMAVFENTVAVFGLDAYEYNAPNK